MSSSSLLCHCVTAHYCITVSLYSTVSLCHCTLLCHCVTVQYCVNVSLHTTVSQCHYTLLCHCVTAHYCVTVSLHTTVSLQHIPALVPSLGHVLGGGALAATEISVPVESTRYHSCSQVVLSYIVHVQNNSHCTS